MFIFKLMYIEVFLVVVNYCLFQRKIKMGVFLKIVRIQCNLLTTTRAFVRLFFIGSYTCKNLYIKEQLSIIVLDVTALCYFSAEGCVFLFFKRGKKLILLPVIRMFEH